MIGRRRSGIALGLVLALAGAVVALSACGGEPATEDGERKVRLVLDYVPNGVHAGIYRGIEAGYYSDEGLDLEVVRPSSTGDPVRLVLAGKADFGLADGLDLAGQISAGRKARAVMAILRRPAGGLITLEAAGIRSPADLSGRTVGETGVPSDRVVFETMVEAAGGDPSESEVIATGFNGAQALVAGRIDAFTGFIPADATALDRAGDRTRSFAFDQFGGPAYPGLVAFGDEAWLSRDPDIAKGFVEATIKGYRDALAEPERAVRDLAAEVQGVEPDFALAVFDAYRPWFGPASGFGRITPRSVAALSEFMVSTGLAEKPVSPEVFGAPGLAVGPLD